jgi:hypothetical protein
MTRSLRIGLIAEGEAELGPSIPYIKPEDGGKLIDRTHEGALHTLIRRELTAAGFPDCQFVQRHPTSRERGTGEVRRGYTILESSYLRKVVTVWKPDEIDMIIIVVDADDLLEERSRKLETALGIIRDSHLDDDGNEVTDRSLTGLAIRDVETWLIADRETVSQMVKVAIEDIPDFETFTNSKTLLDEAIEQSEYLANESKVNQRRLQVRWDIAHEVKLDRLRFNCPNGYGKFAHHLIAVASVTTQRIHKM